MVSQLEQLVQSLGLIGYTAAALGIGAVVGVVIGWLIPRPAKAGAAAPSTLPDISAPAAALAAAIVESKGTQKEKRRNPRRPGRSVEVFIAMPGAIGEPCKGVVIDRSVGGLGLLVGDEYAVGSVIGVLPATASKLTPWVEVEVKSCRKSGDDFELGVQFLKVPPYATMLLFG